MRTLAVVLLAIVPSVATAQDAYPRPDRSVAFTFDDLPVVRSSSLADAQAITTRLLDHISTARIPAIGFVNEGKLESPGEKPARIALLEAWLARGIDLGNHTYSHLRLQNATLAAFEADVLKGERVIRPLMAAHGRPLRYFRHPTLSTGRDLATKAAVERFLAAHGYLVAPVTIDNDEYLYALAYDRARSRADTMQMRRLGDDYVQYMAQIFGHWEALSRALLGREPAQILLLHANALNADWLGALAVMIRSRGYRFISLDRALADEAYTLPDTYARDNGPSWLERWAVTRGADPGRMPALPAWVREAAR